HNKLGLAGLAGKADLATIISGYDAAGNIEAEAGPYTDGLCRKEGLKDLGAVLGWDASPLVGDANVDPVIFHPGTDSDFARFRRGVDGVVEQIGPDLAD